MPDRASRHSAGRRSLPAVFRLPSLSWRWVPIYRRNLLVWRKFALASVLGNIAEPMIILVAFGYGLGRLIPVVDGMPYIVFIAAGSMCMSAMNAASFESLYSAFSRMHSQRTWDSLLNAPLDLDDIVIAEWLWAGTKGLVSGVAIVLVIWLAGISSEPGLVLLPVVAGLTGLCFAAIGLCFNALARAWDFFVFYFTLVITPMIFLSGVWYPVSQLPSWLQPVAQCLPLAAAVELARPLLTGRLPDNVLTPVSLLIAFTLVGLYLALVLTRRRFRA
jgi:lipooligosaccharide transport system permease protein